MICDFADWRPIDVNFTRGGMYQVRGFVPHVQVGDGSLAGFFNNPDRQASSHFWIAKTGTLEQYVDTNDRAWAEGAGNPYFISCEFEGQVDEPMTSQQLDVGGRLIAWVYHNVAQFPLAVNEHPDGQGITPHYAGGAAWGGHSCPGPLRFQQYPELILAALRYMDDNEDDDMTPDQAAQLNGVYDSIGEMRDNLRKLVTASGVAAQVKTLTDGDLTAIARAVNDEQARRQQA